MRFHVLISGLLLVFGASLHAAVVLDQIAATVNGHAILESDVDDEIRCEGLMNGVERKQPPADRKAILDRLVDRELLKEQASSVEYTDTTPDEIDKQLDQVKSDYLNSLKMSWSDALT